MDTKQRRPREPHMLLGVRTAEIKDAAATPSLAWPLCRLPCVHGGQCACDLARSPRPPAPQRETRDSRTAPHPHGGAEPSSDTEANLELHSHLCNLRVSLSARRQADSWRWIGDNLSFPPCTQTSPPLQSLMPRGQAQGRLTTARPQRHSPVSRDMLCFTLRAGDPVCKPWKAPLHSSTLSPSPGP